jgi:Cd2+/Zn2+-exporting ATPase
MWMAVFADVGVTILAVFNAMRTLRPAKEKEDVSK